MSKLDTPHKAFWCIDSACRNRLDTALKSVTQQREDEVEINYLPLRFTRHPAGPAAKIDLSSWRMTALNFTNRSSTQKPRLQFVSGVLDEGSEALVQNHTPKIITLTSAKAQSHV